MLGIARQIARLVRDGHQVALVSSGAIVAGRQALTFLRNGKDIPFKQVLAAVGQTKLMQMWDELFSKEAAHRRADAADARAIWPTARAT